LGDVSSKPQNKGSNETENGSVDEDDQQRGDEESIIVMRENE
jgi:hypothetical protein